MTIAANQTPLTVLRVFRRVVIDASSFSVSIYPQLFFFCTYLLYCMCEKSWGLETGNKARHNTCCIGAHSCTE